MRPGDKIRATSKEFPTTVVEGIVATVLPSGVSLAGTHLPFLDWTIEVIEPASNIPTEPGVYNVTWARGRLSSLNPWTIHPDGRITDCDRNPSYVDGDHLRRATWERVSSNIPTEPGRYNVTWANGDVSRFNPFTVHSDGRITDRDGSPAAPVPSDLHRATWTPVSNVPTEPGRYNVTFANGNRSGYNPFTVHPDGRITDCDGDLVVPRPSALLHRATWERIPDPVWQHGDVAILDGLAWRRSSPNGWWYSLGGHLGSRVLSDADMRGARLLLRDGKEARDA